MRHRSLLVLGLIVAALLWFGSWGGRAQGPAWRTWEYKVAVAQFGAQPASISEQELNRLGAEGWELVGTRVVESSRPGGGREYRTDYYFKRAR